jgi:fructokinase
MKDHTYICSFGEVLWDDFPSGRLPGGAPMNVAIGLQNLGIPTAMISRVGQDELGRDIKAFMQSQNCSTDWVQTDPQHGTGIVKVHASPTGENRYEIVQPIAWDFIECTPETIELVKQAKAIIFGTLACRDAVSRNTLLTLLKSAPLKIYDVNFRPPFYDQALVEMLLAQADIVKMNDDELNIISAWYAMENTGETAQMQYLKDKFNLKIVIVTRGANGAICLDHSGVYESKGFKVQVQDTVGSGDAFLAGFLKNLLDDKAPDHSLKYACALGALVASHKGANPVIKEAEIVGKMEEGV